MKTNDNETAWQPKTTTNNQPIIKHNVANTSNHDKPLKPLTRKQKAFVKHLIENPKQSATQAVLKTYDTDKDYVAKNIASENLTKPNILLELSKYSDSAESTIIEVMQYSKELGKSGTGAGASYATTAGQLANSLLDRVHGKATQRIEQSTTGVSLTIDLTSALAAEDTTE